MNLISSDKIHRERVFLPQLGFVASIMPGSERSYLLADKSDVRQNVMTDAIRNLAPNTRWQGSKREMARNANLRDAFDFVREDHEKNKGARVFCLFMCGVCYTSVLLSDMMSHITAFHVYMLFNHAALCILGLFLTSIDACSLWRRSDGHPLCYCLFCYTVSCPQWVKTYMSIIKIQLKLVHEDTGRAPLHAILGIIACSYRRDLLHEFVGGFAVIVALTIIAWTHKNKRELQTKLEAKTMGIKMKEVFTAVTKMKGKDCDFLKPLPDDKVHWERFFHESLYKGQVDKEAEMDGIVRELSRRSRDGKVRWPNVAQWWEIESQHFDRTDEYFAAPSSQDARV